MASKSKYSGSHGCIPISPVPLIASASVSIGLRPDGTSWCGAMLWSAASHVYTPMQLPQGEWQGSPADALVLGLRYGVAHLNWDPEFRSHYRN